MSSPSNSRPAQDEILNRWNALLNDPLLSCESLKRKATEGELDKSLRSLCWRYFFGLLPSPSSLSADTTSTSHSTTFSTYSLLLTRQRSEYTDLRERFLRAPDGGWIKDGEMNEERSAGGRSSSENGSDKPGTGRPIKVDAKVNNPLGLEEDNPWQSWFADLELRKTIRQDVQRTFPEIDYFRLAPTQNQLTDLLFIYTKLTPDVGYRQGMHELLAPLLWTVDLDSLKSNQSQDESLPHLVLSGEFVEHDTWSLFSTLMKSCAPFYDHKATIPLSKAPQRHQVTGLGCSAVPASSSTSTVVQPIVAIAVHLHSLLATLDPQLHATFTRLQIEPQLYAIRWLRLLFSREFPLSETLTLWDGIFARDPSLQITQHVAAAMLLRIRDALITAERIGGYGEFLQVLLRYPACPDGTFRTSLLLAQATYLRDNLSHEGAEYVRRQNIDLGVTQAHEGGDEETDLRSPAARGAHGQRRNVNGGGPTVNGVALLGEGGLVGDLAKGVYGRAEALGINKAILGTFNDIRRGVTAAQAQLEEQRQRQRAQFSQIPSRAPWESPTQSFDPSSQLRSELAQIRASNIAMASALELCVTVLEKALIPSTPDPSSSSADSRQRPAGPQSNSTANLGNATPSTSSLAPQMMAITAVKHVRDVLGGQAKSFDSSVLGPLQQTLDQLNKSPPLPPLPFDSPFIASQPEEVDPEPPLDSTPTQESLPLQPPSSSSSFPATQRAISPVPSRAPTSQPPSKASPSPNPYISSRSDKPLPSLTRTPQIPSSVTPTASSPSSSDPVTSFNSSRRPSPLLTSYAGSSPAPSRPTSTSSSPQVSIKSPPSPSTRTPFDPLGVL